MWWILAVLIQFQFPNASISVGDSQAVVFDLPGPDGNLSIDPPPPAFTFPVDPLQVDTEAATANITRQLALCGGSLDQTTSGTWQGRYGADGFNVVDDTVKYPAYVTVTITGTSDYVWAPSTNDARALVKPSTPGDRIAATWYSATAFTIDLNFTDANAHQVALYFLDWDGYGGGRSGTVNVLAADGTVTDTRQLANFGAGVYTVFDLSGHVSLQVTNANGSPNIGVSGIFFDPPAPSCDQAWANVCALPAASIPPNCYVDCNNAVMCNRPVIQDAAGTWGVKSTAQ